MKLLAFEKRILRIDNKEFESDKLWNFSCFICEIDYQTGKLINANFTK